MHLSVEQLGDIVRSLRTDLTGGVGKRRHPRVGLRVRAAIELPGGEQVQVRVRDVSIGGINFLHLRELREGESFTLLLPNSEGTNESIPCIVANCQKVASGLFSIGARFHDYNPARKRPRDTLNKLRQSNAYT